MYITSHRLAKHLFVVRKSDMRQLVFFWLWLWLGLAAAQAEHLNGTSELSLWSTHSLGQLLQQCLAGAEAWQCLVEQAERLLDAARQDNNTWQLNEYLSIEPHQHNRQTQQARSSPGLPAKLLELAQGRALQVRLPRQLTISNAIDDFGIKPSVDQGTSSRIDDKIDKIVAGFGSLAVHATATDIDKDKIKNKKKKKKKDKDKDKHKKKKKKKKKKKHKDKKKKVKKKKKKKKKGNDKKKNKNKNCFIKTGRKKKDKDKNMAMMGGMIMLATFAQMFLGKVILIAGAAFIMAKIALVISLLVS